MYRSRWIGALAGIGAFFVFLFYLRSLAQATRNEGLARNIITYVITSLVAPVGLCVLTCVGFMIMGAGMAAAMNPPKQGGAANPFAGIAAMGAMSFVCIGMWVIYMIAMGVWWLILLFQTRSAVGTQLRA